jgi:D-alanyl-lipoteichoic acid acyltransferase DltB (MBOAT superfamily)
MAFNSLEFAIFFGLFFAVFWALRKKHVERTVLLVVASSWFYTRFDYGPTHKWLGWAYLGVLSLSATIDFFLANALHASDQDPRAKDDPAWLARRRKLLLIVSVVYNLGVLAWFKYTGFAIDTVRQVLGAAGVQLAPRTLQVVLPIGISFFTFETMSYTIDVYRRELVPAKSFLEYLGFISFFPHLVAGPIIRPKDMLPQLRRDPELDPVKGSEGLFLVAIGLLKKVVIADWLALNHVDRVFSNPSWFSAPECIAAVYGYALQIYCDFSGYTDVAIGTSLLLGVQLPKNFDSPYKSRDLQEFWRRWHISLSSWLRDYLYIPLGGNRGGEGATYRNLMITMVLGGLWHGASWNFVIWGAMHGGALAVTRVWQRSRKAAGKDKDGPFWVEALKGIGTFHYVCLTWIFFRAEGFGNAFAMLRQIARGGWQGANLTSGIVLVIALGLVAHLVPERTFERARAGFVALPAPVQGACLFLVALVLREVSTSQVVPFVYFQF